MQKKTKKRLIIALILMPVVLPIMVILLLYIPFVQDFATSKLSQSLSDALDMNILVEQVRLKFPAQLSIRNLEFATRNEAKTDETSILNGQIGQLDGTIQLLPLTNERLVLNNLLIKSASVNYCDSLATNKLSAQLDELKLNALDCQMNDEKVVFDILQTEGLEVKYLARKSSEQEDASEPINWQVASGQILLSNSSLEVAMPDDSLFVQTDIKHLQIDGQDLKLREKKLAFNELKLNAPKLNYSVDKQEANLPYTDYQHLRLKNFESNISDFEASFSALPKLIFNLNNLTFVERSGFAVKELKTESDISQKGLLLRNISLKTGHSNFKGDVNLAGSMLRNYKQGQASISSEVSLSPKDIYLLSGTRLSKFVKGEEELSTSKEWTAPIKAKLIADGSLQKLQIKQFDLFWDKVLTCKTKGNLSILNKKNKPSGKLNLNLICGENAQSLLGLALDKEQMKDYQVPNGLSVKGDVAFEGERYQAKLNTIEGKGKINLEARYNNYNKASEVSLQLDSLDVRHFLPKDSIGLVQGSLNFKANNLDIKRPKQVKGEVMLHLAELHYGKKVLKDISLTGKSNQGEVSLAMNSFNKGLDLSLLMDGLLHKKGLTTNLNLDVQDLDPYYWGLVPMPLSSKFNLQGELFSDLDKKHRLELSLSNIKLNIDEQSLSPEELKLNLETTEKECKTRLSSGDLRLRAKVISPLDSLQTKADKLLSHLDKLSKSVVSETDSTRYSIKELSELCPELMLSLSMGKHNALRPYLAHFRISADKAKLMLNNSQKKGLNASLHIAGIRKNALRIDSLNAEVKSLDWYKVSQEHLALSIKVDKDKFRHQEPFHISIQGKTDLNQANIQTQVLGQEQDVLQKLDLNASWLGEVIRLSIPQKEVVLAGHKLNVNTDNYLNLNKRNKLLASKLYLRGEQREGIYLTATDTIAGKQGGSLRLSQIDIAHYLSPFVSDFGGILSAELSYEREGDLTNLPMITGDMSINKLSYENKDLGHFASALFYQPRSDNSHYLTAEVSYAGVQSLSIDGIYRPEHKTKEIETKVKLIDFPLVLANPFLSAFNIDLKGQAKGTLNIDGTLEKPIYNGSISGEKASVYLKEYSSMFELDKQTLQINNGKLLFDNYALLSQANRDNSIYLNGFCEFGGKGGLETDLSISADKLLLFDTKEAEDEVQLLYGKLLASAKLRLRGRGTALNLRGGLTVNTGTNCHYIMKDSPLQVSDNMSEVVSFTDFADTLFTSEPILLDRAESGTDINIGITIEPSVRFTVDLTAGGGDYLRTSGEGKLQLSSPPYGDLSLVGRYTMNGGGAMRYTMPVVGQKTFEISPNSYVSFDGDMMNPKINLRADYKMKANVPDGDKNEKVNFVVSMKAENSIEDLDLSFDLSATDNMKLKSAIRQMTKQERNKQALSLLTTGIYMAKSNKNLNNALTALLEARLNTITNSLLKGTDLNLGMELNNGTNGEAYTNYTYSFSKGFYDERLRFVIGGKVQVGGNSGTNREQSFIDNVALQYQLDKRAEQHLKLYYKRVLDDILEGEHTETGLGFMMARKLRHFSDLFHIFKKKKPKQKEQIKVETFTLPRNRRQDEAKQEIKSTH